MTAFTRLPFPADDLDRIFSGLTEPEWRRLAGQRIFFTGATGFLGKWMLASLIEADRRIGLGCRIEVLTRSPATFAETMPALAGAAGVELLQGDVRSFQTATGALDLVIHGATDVAAPQSPLETFQTCTEGTRRVLDLAEATGARDFLLLSSGAVYGRHPDHPGAVTEDFRGAPDPTSPASAYGEGKRVSEWLACAQGARAGLQVKIARIYAQVGPYLPMDGHFAIGNFIRDALGGQPVVIQGDGRPQRSYLHVTDTVIWLWAMLMRGAPMRAWNVGGAEPITTADLARKVVSLTGSPAPIEVRQLPDLSRPAECYVPVVERALGELQVPQPLDLDEAILRTVRWMRDKT